MIHIHIFDASVELSRDNKFPLLDITYHWKKINKTKDSERRGRPDILHRSLLILQDSPLNLEGMLEFSFSTINDPETTYVLSPEIRLPRNYTRFAGLIAELLRNGEIKSGLIKKTSTEEMLKNKEIILLTRHAKPIGFSGMLRTINLERKQLFLVGGFQKGRTNYPFAIHKKISIIKKTLSASQVCAILTTLAFLKYEKKSL